MEIRPATIHDHEAIWFILESAIRDGETLAQPRNITREDALAYWFGPNHKTFVALENGSIVGTYFLQPNQLGGGSHVANCGYVTAASAVGRGIARRMCEHSLVFAKSSGYRAMQFNFVISTNDRALRLWLGLGFFEIGRLPLAFHSPIHGYVDAIVLYRHL